MRYMVDIVAHANGFEAAAAGTPPADAVTLERKFIPREISIASVRDHFQYDNFLVENREEQQEGLSDYAKLINEYRESKFHRLSSDARFDGYEVSQSLAPRRVRSSYVSFGAGVVGVVGKEQLEYFSNVCRLPHVMDLSTRLPRLVDVMHFVNTSLPRVIPYNQMVPPCPHSTPLSVEPHANGDNRFCSTQIAWYVARFLQLLAILGIYFQVKPHVWTLREIDDLKELNGKLLNVNVPLNTNVCPLHAEPPVTNNLFWFARNHGLLL